MSTRGLTRVACPRSLRASATRGPLPPGGPPPPPKGDKGKGKAAAKPAAAAQSTPDATLVSPLPNAKGKGKAAAKPAAAKAAAAAVPHAGKMCLAVSATGGSYGKASAALVHAWPY